MKNPYLGQSTEILEITRLSSNTKLFKIKPTEKEINFHPGQILEVSIPGFGEAPFAFASLKNADGSFEVCVRKAGNLTSKLHSTEKGDTIYVRGPIGQGYFPIEKKNKPITLIACGIGIIPLRPVIQHFLRENFKDLTIYYAAKKEEDLLFTEDFLEWERLAKLNLALENKSQDGKISCLTGNVTDLIEKTPPPKDSTVYLVGPPIVFKIIPPLLGKLNIQPENIYISLERRMECGLGICQQCAIGPYYTCKEGPVFPYSEINEYLDIF